MPYGIPKEIGGDSKKNVAWMEKCVSSIMEKQPDMSKERAIRICKSQLMKKKKAELDTLIASQPLIDEEGNLINTDC